MADLQLLQLLLEARTLGGCVLLPLRAQRGELLLQVLDVRLQRPMQGSETWLSRP